MKRTIYFPSLSSGALASSLKKNREVKPGLTTRFYAEEFPEKWRHPYFLITAGHHYKKPESRKEYGLENCLVMGDSGGFQLATGAIKWEPKFKQVIFEWLENNSDIAVNLDIPPRAQYEGRFNECLEMSIENFKYFEEHQTGKTKFLNVIQGNHPDEFRVWYDRVKDFQFSGWCIGGARRTIDFFAALAIMLENKEFDKGYNEWVHLLGISKISDFYLLAGLQKCFNLYKGGRIQVSTDSSSPGQYPVFGTYLHSPQLKEMTFVDLYFPKGDKLPYNDSDPVPNPLHHPVSEGFTFGEVRLYDSNCMTKMTLNNLFVYIETCNQCNDMLDAHLELLENILPADFYQVMKSMFEMFESDQPMQVYEKYYNVYKKFSGNHLAQNSNETFNTFFQ
jgi:hypothetical protein